MSSPAVHSVQFYDDHETLIDRLCGIACSGLLIGNSVVIVATQDHRSQLIESLGRLEVEVRTFAREGRFTMIDADELLSAFMRDGIPEPELFRAVVGTLLNDSKRAAKSPDQGLTVFGEMVAVLWEQGNEAGALALERLWNQLMDDVTFHLHCAYPKSLVLQDSKGVQSICDTHSHVLGMFGGGVQ
jgi:hypothetical protein